MIALGSQQRGTLISASPVSRCGGDVHNRPQRNSCVILKIWKRCVRRMEGGSVLRRTERNYKILIGTKILGLLQLPALLQQSNRTPIFSLSL